MPAGGHSVFVTADFSPCLFFFGGGSVCVSGLPHPSLCDCLPRLLVVVVVVVVLVVVVVVVL